MKRAAEGVVVQGVSLSVTGMSCVSQQKAWRERDRAKNQRQRSLTGLLQ